LSPLLLGEVARVLQLSLTIFPRFFFQFSKNFSFSSDRDKPPRLPHFSLKCIYAPPLVYASLSQGFVVFIDQCFFSFSRILICPSLIGMLLPSSPIPSLFSRVCALGSSCFLFSDLTTLFWTDASLTSSVHVPVLYLPKCRGNSVLRPQERIFSPDREGSHPAFDEQTPRPGMAHQLHVGQVSQTFSVKTAPPRSVSFSHPPAQARMSIPSWTARRLPKTSAAAVPFSFGGNCVLTEILFSCAIPLQPRALTFPHRLVSQSCRPCSSAPSFQWL